MKSDVTEGHIQLRDGAILAYKTTGSGDPVILTHSLGYNGSLFQEIRTGLDDYKVITYDLRGHGNSSLGDVAPSLDALADDLMELVVALDIDEAHFLGQSIGAMILLNAASQGRLKGSLILLDTIGWTDSVWSERYEERIDAIERVGMEGIAEQVATVSLGPSTVARSAAAVAEYAVQLQATSPAGYIWSCRAMQSFDFRERIEGGLGLPTCVAAGEEDKVTPLAHARVLGDLIGAQPAVPIPRSGHLPVLENSTFVLSLVRRFWQEHPLGQEGGASAVLRVGQSL